MCLSFLLLFPIAPFLQGGQRLLQQLHHLSGSLGGLSEQGHSLLGSLQPTGLVDHNLKVTRKIQSVNRSGCQSNQSIMERKKLPNLALTATLGLQSPEKLQHTPHLKFQVQQQRITHEPDRKGTGKSTCPQGIR